LAKSSEKKRPFSYLLNWFEFLSKKDFVRLCEDLEIPLLELLYIKNEWEYNELINACGQKFFPKNYIALVSDKICKELIEYPKDRFLEILHLAFGLGIINELPEKCIKSLIEKRKDIDSLESYF